MRTPFRQAELVDRFPHSSAAFPQSGKAEVVIGLAGYAVAERDVLSGPLNCGGKPGMCASREFLARGAHPALQGLNTTLLNMAPLYQSE